MAQSDEVPGADAPTNLPHWRVLLEIALVFAIFFLHGAWPTPDVNENGYLTKAAHFWNHDAFAQDFFCNTGDAHVVYYWVFGWLTTLGLSLDTVAWIGRVATWLMLAIAWHGLSYSLLPRAWWAVLSAELFVLLTEQAHMAGEWIVGGVEAKGFAWALLLWSLQAIVRGKWNWAWLLMGVATSLHVIVGAWGVVCLGISWLAVKTRPSIPEMLPGLVGGLVLAIPGLWFAWKLNQGADWQTVAEASRIQVFQRLPHHLNPLAFQVGYVPRQLLLWAMFVLLCGIVRAKPAERPLRQFVFAAMGLALVGFVLAWVTSLGTTAPEPEEGIPQCAASLLRFYWSRVSDISVPIGVTLVGLQFVSLQFTVRKTTARWMMVGLMAISAYDLWNQARHMPWQLPSSEQVASRSDKFMSVDDWRDVCRWVNDPAHTPVNARFITPMSANTFKWYTGRSEVATWKDMPQDAASIVQWWQRINDLFATGSQKPTDRWRTSVAELGDQNLAALAEKYGAQYAVVELASGVPRLSRKPVYENPSYAVYHFAVENPLNER